MANDSERVTKVIYYFELPFVACLLQENVQVASPIVLSKVNFLRNQTYQDFYIYLLIFDLIKAPQIYNPSLVTKFAVSSFSNSSQV